MTEPSVEQDPPGQDRPGGAGGQAGCRCYSCRLRASWTPAERAAFERDDRADELDERLGPAILPERRAETFGLVSVRRAFADRTGQRQGKLLVLGTVARTRRSGRRERAYRVRCDCGNVVLVEPKDLREGTLSCKPCAARATAAARRDPVVTELCELSGLSRDVVRTRLARGWTRERILAQPGRAA